MILSLLATYEFRRKQCPAFRIVYLRALQGTYTMLRLYVSFAGQFADIGICRAYCALLCTAMSAINVIKLRKHTKNMTDLCMFSFFFYFFASQKNRLPSVLQLCIIIVEISYGLWWCFGELFHISF